MSDAGNRKGRCFTAGKVSQQECTAMTSFSQTAASSERRDERATRASGVTGNIASVCYHLGGGLSAPVGKWSPHLWWRPDGRGLRTEGRALLVHVMLHELMRS